MTSQHSAPARRLSPLPTSFLLLATLALARATAAAEAPREAAVDPAALRAELADVGWTPLATRLPHDAAWEVRPARVPVNQGVWLLLNHPAQLPRPQAVRGDDTIDLPLAADADLLRRDDSGEEPVLTWSANTELTDLGAGLVLLDVDVMPYRPSRPPRRGAYRLEMAETGEVKMVFEPRAPLQVQRQHVNPDPGRRFRQDLEATAFRRPTIASEVAEIVLEPVVGTLGADSLAVTADGGKTWMSLGLGQVTAASNTHALRSRHVFAARWKERSTLFVSAAPVAATGAVQIVAIDPATGSQEALEIPPPTGSEWFWELTDLRVLQGGALEVLAMVHDAARKGRSKGGSTFASWASLMRREGTTWTERRRLPLPADGRAFRLRFDRTAEGGAPLAFLLDQDRETVARLRVAQP